jgi:diacylglycerol kinase
VKPFIYAFKGIATLFRTQRNARIHLGFFVLAVVCGFLFKISLGEWGLIILAAGLVFAAEALNTALEFLADAVHPEQHPKVGQAKDAAAGAVLIAAIAALLVGLMVFVPKILLWIAPN